MASRVGCSPNWDFVSSVLSLAILPKATLAKALPATAFQPDEKWTMGLTADAEYRPLGFRINTEEKGVPDLSAASSDGGVC